MKPLPSTSINHEAQAIERYTGTATARAFNWAALSDADLKREAKLAASERDTVKLWELSEAFLILHGNSGSRVSKHTIDNYERGIRILLEHWQGENLLRPSRDAPLRFVRELEQAGLSSGTIQVRLAAARLLYRALRWARATTVAPFADVKPPVDRTPAEEKRAAYTLEHVAALLKEADATNAALILLAAHGGLRVAEALALDWRHVDTQSNTLRVVDGKGGRTRTIRLTHDLRTALEQLPSEHGKESGYVLPFRSATRARQRLQALCREAGVPYLGMHSLRHTCGTMLYEASGDLRITARHLGHSNTSTTAIYAKMSGRAYDAAIDKIGSAS